MAMIFIFPPSLKINNDHFYNEEICYKNYLISTDVVIELTLNYV